jgi:hypothetical protein
MLLTSQYPTLTASTQTIVDLGITKASQWPAAITLGFVTGGTAADVAVALEYVNTSNSTSSPESPSAVFTLNACPMVGAYYLPSGASLILNPNVFADFDDLKIHLYSAGAPHLYIITER